MKNVTSILKDYFLGWGEEREICERVVFMEMGVGQERLGGKPGRSTTGLREGMWGGRVGTGRVFPQECCEAAEFPRFRRFRWGVVTSGI